MMQAWVKNNGGEDGEGDDQKTAVLAPIIPPVPPFDSAPAASGSPRQKHNSHNYPLHDTRSKPGGAGSPPATRTVTVGPSLDRTAVAKAARLPRTSAVSRLAHHPRNQAPSAYHSSRPASSHQLAGNVPFWEGSTAEGSFSDTASFLALSSSSPPLNQYLPPNQQHAPKTMAAHQDLSYPKHYRPRPFNLPMDDDHQQIDYDFTMRPNGYMGSADPDGMHSPSPARGGFDQQKLKHVAFEEGEEGEEGSSYDGSPEKGSPLIKRRPARVIVSRSKRPSSFSSRSRRAPEEATGHASSQLERQHGHDENEPPTQPDVTEQTARQLAKAPDPRRSSTVEDDEFAGESNANSEEDAQEHETTPKAAPKTKPQISRQLFTAADNAGKSSLTESAMPRMATTSKVSYKPRNAPTSRKRPLESRLDYDDSALASMDYEALRDEAFDYDPAKAEALQVENPPRTTLPEKLDHFLVADSATQTEFFSKMSVNDWEESGDWMLTKFTSIVTRLRQARREKRRTMEGFEEEIAARAEAVEAQDKYVEGKLSDLKAEGEGLMQGMMVEDEFERIA